MTEERIQIPCLHEKVVDGKKNETILESSRKDSSSRQIEYSTKTLEQ